MKTGIIKNSELLLRARDYEAEQMKIVSPSVFPSFHLTGSVGWINDPNGFSLYKGEYHLFFQYNPYSTRWDTMHWGHAKTTDFIRWEHLPCAMAPDMSCDCNGCFSGSALQLEDGRHLLIYTGVGEAKNGEPLQTQCLAFGDGLNYEKFEGNPVIGGNLLPSECSKIHFRDPKIWKNNGKYYVVAGNLTEDQKGAVLLFESDNIFDWKYVGKVASSENRLGRMWECPDLFSLDGKTVLLVSPQEMDTEGPEFIYGNTTLCLIGELTEAGKLLRESEHTIDYGLDFYAPQTTLTADGRRIMVAWMQYWNSVDVCPVDNLPFFGQMTLPRELSVHGGRLIQNPVRELNAYRADKKAYSDIIVQGRTELPDIRGRVLDLTLDIRPAGDSGFESFTVNISEGEGFVTSVLYNPKENTITVDRSKSGWPERVLNYRTFEVSDNSGKITLRFILDKYSMELFVNNGENAATFLIFSPQNADGISFDAEGEAVINVEQYTLNI